MADDAVLSALELKSQAQRRALGAGPVSLSRALGRSLSLAADALLGLALATKVRSDDLLRADRAMFQLPDDAMLTVLDGQEGQRALAVLDRSVVTGLVEVQTLGKITTFPLDRRAFTPTDAAMAAPLLDGALPRMASMMVGQAEMAHLSGLAFGALVEDVQTAALALEADAYQVISFDISLAFGTREGTATFLFPEPPPAEQQGPSPGAGKYESLFETVAAPMHAVLTRIHMPLAKAQALKPGDVLEVSPNAVSMASLVGQGGHLVSRGKLGQLNGFRAIKLGGPEGQVQPAIPAMPLEQAAQAPLPESPSENALAAGLTLGDDISALGSEIPDDLNISADLVEI